jgi:predicted glycogen debranching enzyme
MIQPGWKRGDPLEELVSKEWLVTNGLGGYACGTIGGACTRRFHGKLVAALPAPLGRTMMLNHLAEWITARDGRELKLSGDERAARAVTYPDPEFLQEFVLDCGLPVWRFATNGIRLEKRVVMPYSQNTTYILYRLLEGDGVTLHLRPSLNFRAHEGLLAEWSDTWQLDINGGDVEIREDDQFPPLCLQLVGDARLEQKPEKIEHVVYRIEKGRGYEHEGPLWSPGVIHIELTCEVEAGLVASVESWDVVHAVPMPDVLAAENARRDKMLAKAGIQEQLVLAADQFLIRPHTRSADEARIAAMGDTPRTVIAGYHWFTDWGRDTMISLEGLTLVTQRYREAGSILRTFASYIRDGLIPNMFPEGGHGGLYHTADATMWFFHAIARYVKWTNDRGTLRELLPRLVDIIDHHVRGTRFNIRVDPKDGLLSQGEEGYQLTWMDAKVDGWVVTPRRGKAVEINALFYNALRILEGFLDEEGDAANAARMRALAGRAQKSFNERFWYEEGQYLYDVVDENDAALRPNQIFALSLDHPVLDPSRWKQVLHTVERELLTPLGLRSLARGHPDYKPRYDGDLRARDAAYHQGTVWGWLIGPFIDAWLRVYPDDRAGALRFLDGFKPHLSDACIGTISEVFDAEAPFTPRGCAAQAWSVAEVLRCWVIGVRG